MTRKYTMRSKEEKLSIVNRNLAGETAVSLAMEIGAVISKLDHGARNIRQKAKPALSLRRNQATHF